MLSESSKSDPSPYELAWEAQEAVIRIERGLVVLRTLLIVSMISPALVVLLSHHPQKLAHALFSNLIFAVLSFLALIYLRVRCQAARLRVNQMFILQKSKSHETCGSMDPHLTQAR